MLSAGTHVTTLGPDEPGKAEVSADVIRASLFVCDDRQLAVEVGALRGVGLGPDAVSAEMGEVLAGQHPGRTSSDEITVYAGDGPIHSCLAETQKLALRIGKIVFEEARSVRLETFGADEGVVPLGTEFNVNCDTVDEATFPAPKLDRQLSFLLESSRMKPHEPAIPIPWCLGAIVPKLFPTFVDALH